jgi:hypothetical protein
MNGVEHEAMTRPSLLLSTLGGGGHCTRVLTVRTMDSSDITQRYRLHFLHATGQGHFLQPFQLDNVTCWVTSRIKPALFTCTNIQPSSRTVYSDCCHSSTASMHILRSHAYTFSSRTVYSDCSHSSTASMYILRSHVYTFSSRTVYSDCCSSSTASMYNLRSHAYKFSSRTVYSDCSHSSTASMYILRSHEYTFSSRTVYSDCYHSSTANMYILLSHTYTFVMRGTGHKIW